MPATNPHRSQKWCDVVIVIIRSFKSEAPTSPGKRIKAGARGGTPVEGGPSE